MLAIIGAFKVTLETITSDDSNAQNYKNASLCILPSMNSKVVTKNEAQF